MNQFAKNAELLPFIDRFLPLVARPWHSGLLVFYAKAVETWTDSMCTKNSQKGFTIIELMIVTVLVAIVAAIAVPNFAQMIESNRRTAVANDLAGLLSFARSEAIKRGEAVEIFANNGAFAARMQSNNADIIRVMGGVPNAIAVAQIQGGGNLLFRGSGLANAVTRYRVCGDAGSEGVRLIVNVGGQVRQQAATEDAGDLVCP